MIDDDRDSRLSIAALLGAAGWHARAFATAATFLADPEPRWSCVISDVRMPEADGFEVLAILRRRLECPPIMLMSAHPAAEIGVRAMAAGAAYFFTKPADDDALVAVLEKLVGRRR